MAQRGRPHGATIRLLDDPRRFEAAAWIAFFKLGPYPAGYLTAFFASDKPITTESVEAVLLKSATAHSGDVEEYADRMWRRKIRQVIARADKREQAWLTMSASLILAVCKHVAEGNAGGMQISLVMLRQAGWGETLDRIGKRVEASLRSNFPPAECPLSRTAARLLRQAKKVAP
jgi:hypothetical protein